MSDGTHDTPAEDPTRPLTAQERADIEEMVRLMDMAAALTRDLLQATSIGQAHYYADKVSTFLDSTDGPDATWLKRPKI